MPDAPEGDAATALSLTLAIPAHSDYLRFARLMAVGLATKLDFDYDTIEDLRLAVSELCTAVMTACQGHGEMTLNYRSDGTDALVIDATATYAPGVTGATTTDELFAPILSAVAEEHLLDLGEAGATFMLRMRVGPTAAL